MAADLSGSNVPTSRLSDNELRYRHLYESIPNGVIHQAADGSIVSANPAAERILGVSLAQMQGVTSMDPRWSMEDDQGNPVDGADHPAMIALRTGQPVGPVIRSVSNLETDRRIWLRVTAIPYFPDNDETQNPEVYAYFEDVSEAHESRSVFEAELERRRQYLETILRTSADGFLVIGSDGRISMSNQAATDIIGYTEEELRTFCIHDIDVLQTPDIVAEYMETLKARRRLSFESQLRRKDGSIIDVEISASYADSGGGAFVSFFRDISSRKLAERHIRNLVDEKETLLREMRHRVRNNMSTISSLLSLQLHSVQDETARAILNDTMSRMNSLQILFDELHTTNTPTAAPLAAYVKRLVEHTVQLFSYGTRVRVTYSLDDCEYGVKLLSAVGLIVSELTTNAMKYAFRENTDPRLILSGSLNKDGYVLTVADNGSGMSATEPHPDSTGIGMNIIHALSEQIGATIRFEEDPGVRAVLTIPPP